MSSPKRAAKSVSKAAAKPARRAAAVRPALKAVAVAPASGASADAMRVAAALERGIVDGNLDVVTTEALQKLIAAACRVYTARREAGEQIMPIPKNSISATAFRPPSIRALRTST